MRTVPHFCAGIQSGAGLLAVFALSVIAFAARGDEAKPIALSRLTPAGGRAGTVITVTATGEFPVWPVSVWTDRGQLSWSPQEEVGKFTVTVPADRAFGRHWVRLIDSGGGNCGEAIPCRQRR